MRALFALTGLFALLVGGTAFAATPEAQLADALVESAARSIDLRGLSLDVIVKGASPLDEALSHALGDRLRTFGAREVVLAQTPPVPAPDRWTIDLQLEQIGKVLRASGQLVGGEKKWKLYAEVSTDGPDPLQQVTARQLSIGDAIPLALTIGDSDGDGRVEIVGVSATELFRWQLSGDSIELLERRPLLGASAPIRPRTDVASVRLEPHQIIAHSSRFFDVANFSLPGVGSCELAPGVDWFWGPSCKQNAARLPSRFWNAVGRDNWLAAILPAEIPTPKSGTLWVRHGGDAPMVHAGVGAQLALIAGGVVASAPVELEDHDILSAFRLSSELRPWWRLDVSGSVRAMASGKLDPLGREQLVVAVETEGGVGEIWIIAP